MALEVQLCRNRDEDENPLKIDRHGIPVSTSEFIIQNNGKRSKRTRQNYSWLDEGEKFFRAIM